VGPSIRRRSPGVLGSPLAHLRPCEASPTQIVQIGAHPQIHVAVTKSGTSCRANRDEAVAALVA
jgi:hypothetical protein